MTGVIGCLGVSGVEAERMQPFLEERGVRPEPLESVRFVADDVERGDASGDDGGRRARGEQERPPAVLQPLDQMRWTGDEATQDTDGLRERSHLDVHPAVQAEVIDGAGAPVPEHAARVRVVDHHDRAVLLSDLDEPRERRDVAVHGEHTVGDQQLMAAGTGGLREERVGGVDVLVREHLDLGT